MGTGFIMLVVMLSVFSILPRNLVIDRVSYCVLSRGQFESSKPRGWSEHGNLTTAPRSRCNNSNVFIF